MSDVIIRAENLGKKYTIGHQAENGRYVALRDVVMQNVRTLWHTTRDIMRGKPIIQGDTLEEIWALKDVNFEIRRGEAVGIIGRNGAGKSTLLKILSRITEPSAGRVTIKGRVASLLEVGTGFHPELSGRENIYLNGAILGMTRSEIKRKFDEIVAFAEVEKFLDTPVKRYSSGMYVRLAFAVAAHLEPEILVVDEVLAVGDAAFRKKCLGKMQSVASKGRTVLFVSHNMAAIMALCPNSLLVDAGQIVATGRSQNVVQTYIDGFDRLSSGKSIRDRKDRSGDGSIRVIGLRFGTLANLEGGSWATGADSFVDIEYECVEKMLYRNLEIALGIKHLDQTPLLYLGTKVTNQDIESVTDKGTSRCVLPLLPLEPGRYSLSAELKQNGIIVDHIEAASFVDVVEGDFYGTGVIWPYGGFLCNYSWSHYGKNIA